MGILHGDAGSPAGVLAFRDALASFVQLPHMILRAPSSPWLSRCLQGLQRSPGITVTGVV